MKLFTDKIDPKTKSQLYDIEKSQLFDHIRIMPDVHEGNSIVGFTGYFKYKLSPNVLGPDIGCGMLCINLGKINVNLELFDHRLRKIIPSGANICDKNDKYINTNIHIEKLHCYKSLRNTNLLEREFGTLGGGNHFIELDKDEDDNIYLIIHTGSRNLGKRVWEYYGKLDNYLIDRDLQNYLDDCNICNIWAKTNREIIAKKLCDAMKIQNFSKLIKKNSFDCPHNFIEGNLVRKGALKAINETIIPINMRDGCIIGTGLSNEDWNYSGPHGAGRIMSRNEAKKFISLEEYKYSMKGIFTTSISESTIDESPMAYKNIEDIINNISDTIKIEKIIKPIYNYKHSE